MHGLKITDHLQTHPYLLEINALCCGEKRLAMVARGLYHQFVADGASWNGGER